MAQPHEEVGVQVEAIARQDGLFRRATATDAWVSFDDRDFQTGPRQIGGKRESIVSGSDDDTIELFHSLLPTTASTLLHEPTVDHGVDAFVAVDELRHAQAAGHSDYFRKHLVLAAFGGGEGDRQIYLISQGNLAVPQWVDVNPQQIEPIWRPRQLTPDYVERMRLLNILPPEEFDHEYKGELQIKRGTQDDLRKACPNAFRPGNSAI